MTEPTLLLTLSALVALAAISTLIIVFVRLWQGRERGPWVVCRVASDGSGGMEFYSRHTVEMFTKNPAYAWPFNKLDVAEYTASDNFADVAPLSRYLEGGK